MDLFQKLGFIVHVVKSVLEPSLTLIFWGFILDSEHLVLRPKQARIQAVLKEFHALKKCFKTVKELTRVIGIIVALFPGV